MVDLLSMCTYIYIQYLCMCIIALHVPNRHLKTHPHNSAVSHKIVKEIDGKQLFFNFNTAFTTLLFLKNFSDLPCLTCTFRKSVVFRLDPAVECLKKEFNIVCMQIISIWVLSNF